MFLTLDVCEAKERKEQQEYYMRRAAAAALNSNCFNHRHGALAVNRRTGEIIAEGFNHYSEYMMHAFTCHAEVDVLLKIKKYPKNTINDIDLYVVRIAKQTHDCTHINFKYSKPCEGCTKAILKSGIKKVYFSTDESYTAKTNIKPLCCREMRKY